jgi:hypothetical protein
VKTPSPALVIALVALFVALGGTSYAVTQIDANSVGTKQLKKGAVTSAKISKGTKKALKGNAGPAGPQGAQGAAGAPGQQGVPGKQGEPGTALAYATILSNGTVNENSGSKGITNTNVTNPAAGIYCFVGLPTGAKSALASSSNLGATENDVIVSLAYDTRPSPILDGCPSDATARVRTFDISAAALASRSFVIWLED